MDAGASEFLIYLFPILVLVASCLLMGTFLLRGRPSRTLASDLRALGQMLGAPLPPELKDDQDPSTSLEVRGLWRGRPVSVRWVEGDRVRVSTPCRNPAVSLDLATGSTRSYEQTETLRKELGAKVEHGVELARVALDLVAVPLRANRVSLQDDEAVVELFHSHLRTRAQLDVERVERLLDRLTRLGALSERVAVGLTPRSPAGFGLRGEGTSVVCPYCRDSLAPEREELWSCPACSTLHHTDCQREASGCTVFGCERTRPANRLMTRS